MLCQCWVEFSNIVMATSHILYPSPSLLNLTLGPFCPACLRNTSKRLLHPIKTFIFNYQGVMFGLLPLMLSCFVVNVFSNVPVLILFGFTCKIHIDVYVCHKEIVEYSQ